MKPCGCRADGLTQNVTLWCCSSCGECQSARRRRCCNPDCGRVKPAKPMGYGCCGQDHDASITECVTCGIAFQAEDLAPLPHPEQEYYVVHNERGSFLDRREIRRCVGCLAPEPSEPANALEE
jgi:hypothetical protein